MNATITSQYRRPLVPTLSMILALAAIVIAVIALATAPTRTSHVTTTPAANVAPAPAVTVPAPAVATGPGGVQRVAIPGGYAVQAGIGGHSQPASVVPTARVSGHAAPNASDCRTKRYGTMC